MVNVTVAPNQFDGEAGQDGVDAMFVILSAFIIFTMQSGFGLLESGMVSCRSEANVMIKNMIDVSLGGAAYWFVGYGFSFGPNSKASNAMAGEGYFITDVDISDTSKEAHVYVKYFFQLSFATTATTICSGAVAERVKLGSYMVFAIINTALIYVIPCHWIWGGGWLSGKASDFAGSGVVHMAGGAAALAGTLVLKPRLGRYTKHGTRDFSMASPTNVVLGTFFLWWGWIGFNCGSQFAISGNNWRTVGRVAVVTMNGAMGGGVAAVVYNLICMKWRKYILDVGEFTAGILGGLVAITAPANLIRPWEGLVIGFIGSLVALSFIKLLNKLHIDDPVGCFGVHWGAGCWGMIATGFFASTDNPNTSGVFRKGTGELLGWQLVAGVTITAWCFGCAFIVFMALRYTVGIRLDEGDELRCSDEVEHNIFDPNDSSVGTGVMTSSQRHALGRKVQGKGTNVAADEEKGHDNPVVVVENEC